MKETKLNIILLELMQKTLKTPASEYNAEVLVKEAREQIIKLMGEK